MRQMNIFTDASIMTSKFGETIGCAGAICYEDNNICKYEILRDSTNNISEITAVKLGVLLALENRHFFDSFNIYADSQWSIFGLTKWIRSWAENTTDGVMYNSSGVPVKNQQIFLSIMRLIIDNYLAVNFYHVKGHVNVHDFTSMNNAAKVFERSNGVHIPRSKTYDIAKMNNLVDRNTRELLKSEYIYNREVLNRGIINPIISNEDLNIYYNLVTLGGNKI